MSEPSWLLARLSTGSVFLTVQSGFRESAVSGRPALLWHCFKMSRACSEPAAAGSALALGLPSLALAMWGTLGVPGAQRPAAPPCRQSLKRHGVQATGCWLPRSWAGPGTGLEEPRLPTLSGVQLSESTPAPHAWGRAGLATLA